MLSTMDFLVFSFQWIPRLVSRESSDSVVMIRPLAKEFQWSPRLVSRERQRAFALGAALNHRFNGAPDWYLGKVGEYVSKDDQKTYVSMEPQIGI